MIYIYYYFPNNYWPINYWPNYYWPGSPSSLAGDVFCVSFLIDKSTIDFDFDKSLIAFLLSGLSINKSLDTSFIDFSLGKSTIEFDM